MIWTLNNHDWIAEGKKGKYSIEADTCYGTYEILYECPHKCIQISYGLKLEEAKKIAEQYEHLYNS